MQFHDKRYNTAVPVPVGLERLYAIMVAFAIKDGTWRGRPDTVGKVVTLTDHDPKTGLVVTHLQLNHEPEWLDEAFKEAWSREFGKRLRSELLENTEWKRFAWGVWEE